MSSPITSPRSAAFPEALLAVQRAPESPITYALMRRVADALAGFCDRRVVTLSPDQVAGLPWLQRLGAECRTALEAERRAAHANLAALDTAVAAARQSIETSEVRAEELRQRLGALNGQEISAAATTAADAGDDPAVRRSRKQQQRDIEVGRMDGQLSQFDATVDANRQAIQTLLMARRWHWTLLLTRSVHLIAHYDRRAATYTRHALREAATEVYAPQAREPQWLQSGPPPVTDPISD